MEWIRRDGNEPCLPDWVELLSTVFHQSRYACIIEERDSSSLATDIGSINKSEAGQRLMPSFLHRMSVPLERGLDTHAYMTPLFLFLWGSVWLAAWQWAIAPVISQLMIALIVDRIDAPPVRTATFWLSSVAINVVLVIIGCIALRAYHKRRIRYQAMLERAHDVVDRRQNFVRSALRASTMSAGTREDVARLLLWTTTFYHLQHALVSTIQMLYNPFLNTLWVNLVTGAPYLYDGDDFLKRIKLLIAVFTERCALVHEETGGHSDFLQRAMSDTAALSELVNSSDADRHNYNPDDAFISTHRRVNNTPRATAWRVFRMGYTLVYSAVWFGLVILQQVLFASQWGMLSIVASLAAILAYFAVFGYWSFSSYYTFFYSSHALSVSMRSSMTEWMLLVGKPQTEAQGRSFSQELPPDEHVFGAFLPASDTDVLAWDDIVHAAQDRILELGGGECKKYRLPMADQIY